MGVTIGIMSYAELMWTPLHSTLPFLLIGENDFLLNFVSNERKGTLGALVDLFTLVLNRKCREKCSQLVVRVVCISGHVRRFLQR